MAIKPPGRFIDLHLVQAVPFACLNRDDTNSVKTAQFGGVNRTRVSRCSYRCQAARVSVVSWLVWAGEPTIKAR
jgi:hypothetical protein